MNKIEKTLTARIVQLGVYSFLLGSVLLLALGYNTLPEEVPIYFNWPTKNEGLADREVLWVLPMIFSVISWVLLSLANRPQILNYPVRITEKNAGVHYSSAALMLRLLSLLVAITCLLLVLGSLSGSGGELHIVLDVFFSLLPFLFFGLPLFFVFKIVFQRNS